MSEEVFFNEELNRFIGAIVIVARTAGKWWYVVSGRLFVSATLAGAP